MSPLGALLLQVLLGATTLAAPPKVEPIQDDGTQNQRIERLPGFAAVVLSQVTSLIGIDVIPVANGFALDPGMFVTIGLDRIVVTDHEIAKLRDGRIVDTVAASECGRLCPASIYDGFQAEWLMLAIESTQRDVQIPGGVVIAAHGRLPVSTLLATLYAVATSRPLHPPSFALVLAGAGRGLRGQPFFVLPPEGLRLSQGAAALGLQIQVGRAGFSVSADDPDFNRRINAPNTTALRGVLRDVKKRYPSKEAVVLVPDETVTVADLVEVMVAVRAEFPRIILSAGQRLELQ